MCVNTEIKGVCNMEEIKDFLRSRTVVNLTIVAANILVFLILEMGGNTNDVEYMLMHGASYAPWIQEYGEYYRLFTCMFLHFGIEHLFNNMLVLIFLGDTLERTIGKWKYLLLYLAGGVGASLISYGLELRSGDYAASAGASGAIFAVVGALLYIVIVNKGRLEDITGRRLLLMAGLTIFQGFTTIGVDNAAHIGGLVCGFLLGVILYRRPREVQYQS